MLETDATDLALGADGDLDIVSGDLRLARGIEAAAQGCRVRMLTVRGELLNDRSLGFPWFESDVVPRELAVIGKPYSEQRVAAESRAAIQNSEAPEIVEVVSLSSYFEGQTRRVTIQFEARTAFGETVNDQLVVPA